jgi:hypothetical protein
MLYYNVRFVNYAQVQGDVNVDMAEHLVEKYEVFSRSNCVIWIIIIIIIIMLLLLLSFFFFFNLTLLRFKFLPPKRVYIRVIRVMFICEPEVGLNSVTEVHWYWYYSTAFPVFVYMARKLLRLMKA